MRRSLLLPALLVAACSSDPARTGDSGPPGGGDGGFPVDGASHDATTMDATPHDDAGSNPDAEGDAGPDAGFMRDPSCPGTASWAHTVRGTIVDQNNAPSAAAKAQFCARTLPSGTLLCLRPVDSDGAGNFQISIPMQARCYSEATMRFVRPGEDFAVTYCALTAADVEGLVTVAAPFHVFAAARATSVPPLGDDTMRRTVRFGGGLEIDLVPHDYFPGTGTYEDLAAVLIPAASADACILAGEPSFDGIYAFSPEGDTTGRTPMRIPNSAHLAANRAVRVFVLGGLSCTLDDGTILQEGRWHEIEPSAVSADGMTIPVTPGAPCLNWLAYRGD